MPDALRKATWTEVSLGECCDEIAQRIDNPTESGFDRFVGLEHLETGETSIRSWGRTEDVTSSMKLFKAGDVIVARRNVYLRRAARADFDGVCSGDGIVLRGNPKVCLPELVPHLLNTDSFWNYVTSQADGTMSKRITVKRLLSYEFALPPLDDQRRIAEALTSSVELSEKLSLCGASARQLLKSSIEAGAVKLSEQNTRIGDLVDRGIIASPQDGNHGEIHPKAADYVGEGIPFLMAADVRDGVVDLVGCKFIAEEQARSLRVGFSQPGDVLLTHKGTLGETAILPTLDHAFVMLTPQVTYYRVEDESQLLPRYLYYVFQSASFYRQMLSRGRQSTRLFVGITNQRELEIPFPKLAVQRRLVEQWSKIESSAQKCEERRAMANTIVTSLRNEAFAAGGVE